MDDETLLRWRLAVDAGRSYLALVGELDMSARPELDRAFEAISADRFPVTIDLDEVSFLDGGGTDALMGLAQQLADVGVDVTYGRYPRPVLRYLELAQTSLTAS
jgi:anti-anti-sigma factor